MDDYKKMGVPEWGRKARKQISRASKGSFRAQARKQAEAETAKPTALIQVGRKKYRIFPSSGEALKLVVTGTAPCLCGKDLVDFGWQPHNCNYIECVECVRRFPIQETKP